MSFFNNLSLGTLLLKRSVNHVNPESAFIVRLVTSFFVGGLWVSLSTLLAQRLGSKVGGIIAGLPSTALVALLFVALTQGVESCVEATSVVPASLSATCLLMVVYSYSLEQGVWKALGCGLVAWFLAQFVIILFSPFPLLFSLLLAAAGLSLAVFIFERGLKIDSTHGKKIALHPPIILLRAFLAGTVVTLSVLLARYVGPLLSGIFSVFPITMTSTLYVTFRDGGPDFSKAVAKAHMVSGVFTCSIYATAIHFFLPIFGLWQGTLFAYLLALFSSAFVAAFMKRYMR